MMKFELRKFIFTLLAILIIVVSIIFKPLFDKFELLTFDYRTKLSSDESFEQNKIFNADKNIVIIEYDDISAYELSKNSQLHINRWPPTRKIWADVINYVEQAHPKVLVLDFIFSNYEDPALSTNSPDVIFSNALKKYNNIVIGTSLNSPFTRARELKSTEVYDLLNNPFQPTAKSLDLKIDNEELDKEISFYSYAPVPDIFSQNAIIGVTNLPVGEDTIVRKTQPIYKLVKENESFYLPSLAYATMLKYYGLDFSAKLENSLLKTTNNVIPLNKKGQVSVNWHQNSFDEENTSQYLHIPISKILLAQNSNQKEFSTGLKKLPLNFLKDKIVIIAQTQTNTDIHSAPVASNISGAEIQATVIDNFINDANYKNLPRKKFIRELPNYVSLILTFIFCALIIATNIYLSNSLIALVCSSFLVMIYAISAVSIFINPFLRLSILMVYPVYYMISAFIISYAYKLYEIISKKTQIAKVFGKFISKHILSQLMDNPEKFELNTRKKYVSVMFCDVKNFTKLTETYPDVVIINRLNQLFEIITDCILQYNGTIDKFIGDSVMAYWGDPIANDDDAINAVNAAIEIQHKIDEFNKNLSPEDPVKMFVKIAINSGFAFVGMIGSQNTASYTLIGDTVNTASRIEGICTQFGKSILISENTYKKVMNEIEAQYAGAITPKGKSEKISLYAPEF